MLRTVANRARTRCRPLQEDSCYWLQPRSNYSQSFSSSCISSSSANPTFSSITLQRNGTILTTGSHRRIASQLLPNNEEAVSRTSYLQQRYYSQRTNEALTHGIRRYPSRNQMLSFRFNVNPRHELDILLPRTVPNKCWFTIDSKNNGQTELKQTSKENLSLEKKGEIKSEDSIQTSLSKKNNSELTKEKSSDTISSGKVQQEIKNSDGTPTIELLNKIRRDRRTLYGTISLIAAMVVVPMVVDLGSLYSSDSTDDDIDPEDPVADLAKVFLRDHFGHGENGAIANKGAWTLDSMIAVLLRSEKLQQALSDLVSQVIQSPEFKRSCQVLLKELWTDLIHDPETTAQVIHLLQHAIQDEQIKEAAIHLVMDVVNDKEVLEELTALLQRLGREEKVQGATRSLLVESAHNALNDPEILDHSMEFATDVVGDDVVQRTAGEALYNTVSYAVRPTLSVLFSLLGAGLIVMSIVAFRSELISEDSQLERALSALVLSLESTALRVNKLISIPGHILNAIKNAIVAVVTLPFRLVRGSVASAERAGNTIANTVSNVIRWISSLPGYLADSIVAYLGHGTRIILDSISNQSRQTVAALSASIIGTYARHIVSFLSDVTTYVNTTIIDATSMINASIIGATSMINATVASLNLALSQGIVMYEKISKAVIKISSESLPKVIRGIQAAQDYYSRIIMTTERSWSVFLDKLVEIEQAGGIAAKQFAESLSKLRGLEQKMVEFLAMLLESMPFDKITKR